MYTFGVILGVQADKPKKPTALPVEGNGFSFEKETSDVKMATLDRWRVQLCQERKECAYEWDAETRKLRILKDLQAGDNITIGASNGISYNYIVREATIVKSDKALRFEAMEGKALDMLSLL